MSVQYKTLVLLIAMVTSTYSFERVPKQYALETGGIYAHKNEVSQVKSPGVIVMFDYSWQLSGLDGSRAASFISVPIGYTYFTEDPTVSILSYGWTIRHNLLKKRSILPFLGYGLLLNQLSFKPEKGKRFGHQTRFDVGCEWKTERPIHLFSKIEWSMTRFPDRLTDDSDWLYSLALKVGVRLFKPARKTAKTETMK